MYLDLLSTLPEDGFRVSRTTRDRIQLHRKIPANTILVSTYGDILLEHITNIVRRRMTYHPHQPKLLFETFTFTSMFLTTLLGKHWDSQKLGTENVKAMIGHILSCTYSGHVLGVWT